MCVFKARHSLLLFTGKGRRLASYFLKIPELLKKDICLQLLRGNSEDRGAWLLRWDGTTQSPSKQCLCGYGTAVGWLCSHPMKAAIRVTNSKNNVNNSITTKSMSTSGAICSSRDGSAVTFTYDWLLIWHWIITESQVAEWAAWRLGTEQKDKYSYVLLTKPPARPVTLTWWRWRSALRALARRCYQGEWGTWFHEKTSMLNSILIRDLGQSSGKKGSRSGNWQSTGLRCSRNHGITRSVSGRRRLMRWSRSAM